MFFNTIKVITESFEKKIFSVKIYIDQKNSVQSIDRTLFNFRIIIEINDQYFKISKPNL